METITLKRSHFGKNGRVVLTPDAVSSGHWALRRVRVANVAAFASLETAQAALKVERATEAQTTLDSIAGPEKVHEWAGTRWLCDLRNGGAARIFVSSETGETAAIDTRYLALIGADAYTTLYGASPVQPFRDAADRSEATFVVMPVDIRDGAPFPTPRPPVEA